MQNLYKIIFLLILLPSFASAGEFEDVKAAAEGFFASTKTMKAEFVQSDAQGNVSGGEFLLKRPGKFRWEYDERQPLLIISSGDVLVYRDKELDETTYLPAESTLASFLGRKIVKFEGDIILHEAFADPEFMKVLISQKERPEEGKLAFYFSKDAKSLLGMEVIDSANYATKISFENQIYDQPIAAGKFVYKDADFHKNAWE